MFCESLELLEELLRSTPKEADIESMEIRYQKSIDVMISEKADLEYAISRKDFELKERENEVSLALETSANCRKAERLLEEQYECSLAEERAKAAEFTECNSTLLLKCKELDLQVERYRASSSTSGNTIHDLNSNLSLAKTAYELLSKESSGIKEKHAVLLNEYDTSVYRENCYLTQIQELQTALDLSHSEYIKLKSENLHLASTIQSDEIRHLNIEKELDTYRNLAATLQEQLNKSYSIDAIRIQKIENMSKDLCTLNADMQIVHNQKTCNDMDIENLKLNMNDQINSLKAEHILQLSKLRNIIEQQEAVLEGRKTCSETLQSQLDVIRSDLADSIQSKDKVTSLLERCNEQKLEMENSLQLVQRVQYSLICQFHVS